MHLAVVCETLQTYAYGPNSLVSIGKLKVQRVVGKNNIRFAHQAGKTINIAVHLTHATIHLYKIHIVQLAWI